MIVGYFSSPEEVDKYIGEMFRQASNHPQVGPKMRAANVTMKVVYQDPDCEMTVRFVDPMETTSPRSSSRGSRTTNGIPREARTRPASSGENTRTTPRGRRSTRSCSQLAPGVARGCASVRTTWRMPLTLSSAPGLGR